MKNGKTQGDWGFFFHSRHNLLRFLPVANHLIEAKVLHAFALLAGLLLHVAKALAELLVGFLQGIVGIHTDINAVSCKGKEQIAVFLLDAFRVL